MPWTSNLEAIEIGNLELKLKGEPPKEPSNEVLNRASDVIWDESFENLKLSNDAPNDTPNDTPNA